MLALLIGFIFFHLSNFILIKTILEMKDLQDYTDFWLKDKKLREYF
jgi:hypothetical protein